MNSKASRFVNSFTFRLLVQTISSIAWTPSAGEDRIYYDRIFKDRLFEHQNRRQSPAAQSARVDITVGNTAENGQIRLSESWLDAEPL